MPSTGAHPHGHPYKPHLPFEKRTTLPSDAATAGTTLKSRHVARLVLPWELACPCVTQSAHASRLSTSGARAYGRAVGREELPLHAEPRPVRRRTWQGGGSRSVKCERRSISRGKAGSECRRPSDLWDALLRCGWCAMQLAIGLKGRRTGAMTSGVY